MSTPHALVVENDADVRSSLVRLLEPHYIVVETNSAELAFDLLLHGYEFDVILCELGLDGWSGADLYDCLERRRDRHASRFVVLSGLDVRARRPGLAAALGDRLLAKPVRPNALLNALAAVRDRAQAAA